MKLRYILMLFVIMVGGYATAMINLDDFVQKMEKELKPTDNWGLSVAYVMKYEFPSAQKQIKQDLISDQKNRDLFIDKVIKPMINYHNTGNEYKKYAKELYNVLQDPALDTIWQPFVKDLAEPAYATFLDLEKAYRNEKDVSKRAAIITSLNQLDAKNIVAAGESPSLVNDFNYFLHLVMTDAHANPTSTEFFRFMMSLEKDLLSRGGKAEKAYEELVDKHIPFHLLLSLEKIVNLVPVNFPMQDYLFEKIGGPLGDIQFIQLFLLDKSDKGFGVIEDKLVKQLAAEWVKETDKSKKDHAFTVSEYIENASQGELEKGEKYTTLDLLKNPTLKLDRFLSDFGFTNTILDAKELQQKMHDFGSALADIK